MNRIAVLACAIAAGGGAHAQDDSVLRNWFNDPFFQIAGGIADCPLPQGPLMTEAERRVQSHHRAEKGTTCWLAGQCETPSVYADDAGIAEALRSRLAEHNPFTDATLWVTVQGRVVYFEGCARDPAIDRNLEALARTLPKVQQAIAAVGLPGAEPPYKRLPAGWPEP